MAGLPESEFLRLRQRTRDEFPEAQVVTEPERLFEIDKFRRQSGRPATQMGDAVRSTYNNRIHSDAQAAQGLFNSRLPARDSYDVRERELRARPGATRQPDNLTRNGDGTVDVDLSRYGVPSLSGVREVAYEPDATSSFFNEHLAPAWEDTVRMLGEPGSYIPGGNQIQRGIERIPVVGDPAAEAFGLAPQIAISGVGPAGTALGAIGSVAGERGAGAAAEAAGASEGQQQLARIAGGLVGGGLGTAAGTRIDSVVRAANAAATPGLNPTRETLAVQDDATQSLVQRIKTLQPLEAENADLLSDFRSKQAAGFADNLGEGQAGFRAGLAGMRGQAERVGFTPLAEQLDQPQIDDLFNRITRAGLGRFEHAQAGEALQNILDGVVPQPSRTAQLERVFPGITSSMQRAGILKGPSWSDEARDLVSLPQSVVSAFDLSGLRQTATAAHGHPRMFGRNFVQSLKAAVNEDTFNAVMDDIRLRPTAQARNAAGVVINTSEQMLDPGGLTWASRILNRVPGYRPSQRAYSALVNGMRADLFDSMLANYGGVPDARELAQWGRLVNASTGRGALPGILADTSLGGSPVFWAPRLIASRVQMPFELFSSSAAVRKEAARQLIAFVGVNATIVGAGAKGGLWESELNPTSADFGQIRIGRQRIDPWAGFRPLVNLTARLITGERKSTVTGEVTEVNDKEIVQDFLRSKLSPLTAAGVNIWTGKDALGNPYGGKDALGDTLVPLFLRDLTEAAQEAGVRGFSLATLAGVGLGVNTYEESPFDKAAKSAGYDLPYVSLTPSQKQMVDDLNPDLVDERSRQIISRGGPRADYERLKVDLRAEQQYADAQLAAGNMDISTWRDQRSSRLDQLKGGREVAFANAPDRKSKDAVDRFFDQVETLTLGDGSVDWDRVEAWVGEQSADDQKYITENTGIGGTETERKYRATVKNLDEAGYFNIGDQSWAVTTETAPPQFAAAVAPYATFGDWADAVKKEYEQRLVASGFPEGAASEEAANALARHPIYKAYSAAVDHYHKQFVVEHPNLMDQAVVWGLGGTDQAERRFIAQVLTSASPATGR